jgi:hypothetical protein
MRGWHELAAQLENFRSHAVADAKPRAAKPQVAELNIAKPDVAKPDVAKPDAAGTRRPRLNKARPLHDRQIRPSMSPAGQ